MKPYRQEEAFLLELQIAWMKRSLTLDMLSVDEDPLTAYDRAWSE